MYKKGYHHLLTADGHCHNHVVVSFDNEGNMLSWHTLEGEEPFVEWVGGTFREPNGT